MSEHDSYARALDLMKEDIEKIRQTQELLESAYETVSHSAAYDKPITEKFIKAAKESIEEMKDSVDFKYDLYVKAMSDLELAWSYIKLDDTIPLPIIYSAVHQAAHDILSLRTFVTSIHKKINFSKLCDREKP